MRGCIEMELYIGLETSNSYGHTLRQRKAPVMALAYRLIWTLDMSCDENLYC